MCHFDTSHQETETPQKEQRLVGSHSQLLISPGFLPPNCNELPGTEVLMVQGHVSQQVINLMP